MKRTVSDVVVELCTAFPNTTSTHGEHLRTFKVRKTTFAYYAINHHGDQRVALWLRVPEELQSLFIQSDPERFFSPPYVGSNGWLGVLLAVDADWEQITGLVIEAYQHSAGKLTKNGISMSVRPPTHDLEPDEIDPLASPKMIEFIEHFRKYSSRLPEFQEASQFGHPSFKAGRKTFATIGRYKKLPFIEVWVGSDGQVQRMADARFEIPRYTGHNGWIIMYVQDEDDYTLAESLILESYKHFALKRMLNELNNRGLEV